MRYYPPFPRVIPHLGAGCPRVPHPSATSTSPKAAPFDLHALGTPPALILSQDQTLHQLSPPTPRCRRVRGVQVRVVLARNAVPRLPARPPLPSPEPKTTRSSVFRAPAPEPPLPRPPSRARRPLLNVQSIPTRTVPPGMLFLTKSPLLGYLTALRESMTAGENQRPAQITKSLRAPSTSLQTKPFGASFGARSACIAIDGPRMILASRRRVKPISASPVRSPR